MTEPPDPWAQPADPPDPPPPNWQPPPPPGQVPWGGYTPPPGWQPPRQNSIRSGELFAGIAACIGVNLALLLVGTRTGAGDQVGLVALVVNLACIIGPAVRGHKGFAVGFALGYVAAFVLLLGACFVLLATAGGMG